MNRYFNINRINLHARQKFFLILPNFLVFVGALFGVVAIIFVGISNFGAPAFFPKYHDSVVSVLLGFITTIIASQAFFDIKDEMKSQIHLALPISNLERFLVPFIITSVGWIIFSLGFYLILANLLNLYHASSRGIAYVYFNPFSALTPEIFGGAIFYHSIFFTGAVIFRKNPYFKTILLLIIILFAFAVLSFIIPGNLVFTQGTEDGAVSVHIGAFKFDLEDFIDRYLPIVGVVIPIALYTASFYLLQKRSL